MKSELCNVFTRIKSESCLFMFSRSTQKLFLCPAFISEKLVLYKSAFTLVEMLMALLIVSVILSASLPVISQRTKSQSVNSSKYSAVPIGMIAMWKVDGSLPDSTWLEANGQVIPNGIEYEECRKIFGSRLPDLRGADSEFYTNLNNYLSKDIKDYLQSAIKPLPKDFIGIWGTNAAIPEGWSEASEYRGVFLRGYGTITHTQNNGSIVGNTATSHSSGAIGAVQGDAIRKISGKGGGVIMNVYEPLQKNYVDGPFYGNPSLGHLWNFTAQQYFSTTTSFVFFDNTRVTPSTNEIRPINKAVKFIRYTKAAAMPDLPKPPNYIQKFRYIVKVRN